MTRFTVALTLWQRNVHFKWASTNVKVENIAAVIFIANYQNYDLSLCFQILCRQAERDIVQFVEMQR